MKTSLNFGLHGFFETTGQTNSEVILLFADAAEVSLLPTLTRCWSRIGQQRVVLTPGVHAPKYGDGGAVDPVSGRTVHILHPRRTSRGFRRLLAAISRAFELPAHPQRRIVLFVDNDQAHHTWAVQRLLSKYPTRIQLEWLPPYSPELNPQEDIWRHLRRRVTHNYYFGELGLLLDAVRFFYQDLQDHPDQVLALLKKWTHFISA